MQACIGLPSALRQPLYAYPTTCTHMILRAGGYLLPSKGKAEAVVGTLQGWRIHASSVQLSVSKENEKR
jgi:hypothetical protein